MRLFVKHERQYRKQTECGVKIGKKKKFFAKLQAKVGKPVWKEENVVVTKLSPHKSIKHKQE